MESSNASSEVRAGQVDMISHLPDEIICRILSLIPTRYSIRTSVLSKRWERLWVFAPKLDLEFDRYESPMEEQYEDSFTRFVDLLFLRDNLCFHSLRLCILNAEDEANIDGLRLNSWFFGVLKCNIRELDLEIWRCDTQLPELPWMLFTCKTLVVLKICGLFVVNVPYYVWLPNLKTLVLDNVIYSGDESLPKLLSGCPILEDLQLLRDARQVLSTYDVSHPKLKRLKLELDDPYDGRVLECNIRVDAPNLEFIDLKHRTLGDVLLNSLPSTAKVHVDFCQFSDCQEEEIEHGNIVLAFLKSIANLKALILYHGNLKYSAHAIGSNLPTFRNLVQLNINMVSAIFPKLLMGFLENSPKLEVLSLPSGIRSDKTEFHYEVNVKPEYGWHKPQHVPVCLLYRLKCIEIHSFWVKEDELNAVKYLLENAMVLEKMTIRCNYSPTSVEFAKLQMELANHPWGSTNCQLHFLHK